MCRTRQVRPGPPSALLKPGCAAERGGWSLRRGPAEQRHRSPARSGGARARARRCAAGSSGGRRGRPPELCVCVKPGAPLRLWGAALRGHRRRCVERVPQHGRRAPCRPGRLQADACLHATDSATCLLAWGELAARHGVVTLDSFDCAASRRASVRAADNAPAHGGAPGPGAANPAAQAHQPTLAEMRRLHKVLSMVAEENAGDADEARSTGGSPPPLPGIAEWLPADDCEEAEEANAHGGEAAAPATADAASGAVSSPSDLLAAAAGCRLAPRPGSGRHLTCSERHRQLLLVHLDVIPLAIRNGESTLHAALFLLSLWRHRPPRLQHLWTFAPLTCLAAASHLPCVQASSRMQSTCTGCSRMRWVATCSAARSACCSWPTAWRRAALRRCAL